MNLIQFSQAAMKLYYSDRFEHLERHCIKVRDYAQSVELKKQRRKQALQSRKAAVN